MVRLIGRKMNESTVSIDARSWEGACDALLNSRQFHPDGHTLIAAKIVRRGAKGGRRCQLHLIFRWTNHDFQPLDKTDLAELFAKEINLASYRDEPLPIG